MTRSFKNIQENYKAYENDSSHKMHLGLRGSKIQFQCMSQNLRLCTKKLILKYTKTRRNNSFGCVLRLRSLSVIHSLVAKQVKSEVVLTTAEVMLVGIDDRIRAYVLGLTLASVW